MIQNGPPVKVGEISLPDAADTASVHNYPIRDEGMLEESPMSLPVEHAWPEAADILEILMNADAGWPMDVHMPLLDMNASATSDTCHAQSGNGEGSFARAQQAMQHMSNLMQDLVSDNEKVRITGCNSD